MGPKEVYDNMKCIFLLHLFRENIHSCLIYLVQNGYVCGLKRIGITPDTLKIYQYLSQENNIQ